MVSRRMGRTTKSRAGQRGAAVFVVVVVITMLAAVGLFAAKSAALSIRASGHERQMIQAHYMNEYAMNLIMADVRVSTNGYLQELHKDSSQQMTGCEHDDPSLDNYKCYRAGVRDLERLMRTQNADQYLLCQSVEDANCADASAGADPNYPSPLGDGDLDVDFRIEISDPTAALAPVAGYDAQAGSKATHNTTMESVTISTTGQVRPYDASSFGTSTGAGVDLFSSSAATIEYGRVHVTVRGTK